MKHTALKAIFSRSRNNIHQGCFKDYFAVFRTILSRETLLKQDKTWYDNLKFVYPLKYVLHDDWSDMT
jgi:hypothetical protein